MSLSQIGLTILAFAFILVGMSAWKSKDKEDAGLLFLLAIFLAVLAS